MKEMAGEHHDSLSASVETGVRFSEVDSMNIVWHGSYPLYLEDAREAFGKKYGIGYLDIFANGLYTPLVELNFRYRKAIRYGMTIRVDIFYRPSPAAKLMFDYEIRDASDNSLMATANSVQVFTDHEGNLQLYSPDFYNRWKKKWNVGQ